MTSPFQKPEKSARASLDFSVVKVKCSHCGNTFYAPRQEAVCPKCERPANRELEPIYRALSLLVPPLGISYALWIRPHSPLAAAQSLKWSLWGGLILSVLILAVAWF